MLVHMVHMVHMVHIALELPLHLPSEAKHCAWGRNLRLRRMWVSRRDVFHVGIT